LQAWIAPPPKAPLRFDPSQSRFRQRRHTGCEPVSAAIEEETAMTVRKALAVAGAIALGFTSFGAHASGADAAIDACVKSFVDANLKDRIVRVRKQPFVATSPLFPHPRDTYTVALTARGVNSGELIAQARCVASTRGRVIVLDSPDPSSYTAKADFAVTMK
jgi:hypothetical protein